MGIVALACVLNALPSHKTQFCSTPLSISWSSLIFPGKLSSLHGWLWWGSSHPSNMEQKEKAGVLYISVSIQDLVVVTQSAEMNSCLTMYWCCLSGYWCDAPTFIECTCHIQGQVVCWDHTASADPAEGAPSSIQKEMKYARELFSHHGPCLQVPPSFSLPAANWRHPSSLTQRYRFWFFFSLWTIPMTHLCWVVLSGRWPTLSWGMFIYSLPAKLPICPR